MSGSESAKYQVVDPQGRGPDAIIRAFENQVAYCRDNGAPITASVCQALLELIDGERGGTVMERVRRWAGAPLADALPLRVAGGLHTLHLSGSDPSLAPIYAGQRTSNASEVIAASLETNDAFLLPWLDGPPQTNEAGRSSNFAAALAWLVSRGLPPRFSLNEIGSSAGINLMMDRYRYELGGQVFGPENAMLTFSPEWKGSAPPAGNYSIESAQGCDVAPVDLTEEAQALRLRGYIWPEMSERFRRMDGAVAAANEKKPQIEQCNADEFVRSVLDQPADSGVTRVVMHSVVWQYIAEEERERICEYMEDAGSKATSDAPLAWISLEANRDTHRHELQVRYWPSGGEWTKLATAHPHGEWIEWSAS